MQVFFDRVISSVFVGAIDAMGISHLEAPQLRLIQPFLD